MDKKLLVVNRIVNDSPGSVCYDRIFMAADQRPVNEASKELKDGVCVSVYQPFMDLFSDIIAKYYGL